MRPFVLSSSWPCLPWEADPHVVRSTLARHSGRCAAALGPSPTAPRPLMLRCCGLLVQRTGCSSQFPARQQRTARWRAIVSQHILTPGPVVAAATIGDMAGRACSCYHPCFGHHSACAAAPAGAGRQAEITTLKGCSRGRAVEATPLVAPRTSGTHSSL